MKFDITQHLVKLLDTQVWEGHMTQPQRPLGPAIKLFPIKDQQYCLCLPLHHSRTRSSVPLRWGLHQDPSLWKTHPFALNFGSPNTARLEVRWWLGCHGDMLNSQYSYCLFPPPLILAAQRGRFVQSTFSLFLWPSISWPGWCLSSTLPLQRTALNCLFLVSQLRHFSKENPVSWLLHVQGSKKLLSPISKITGLARLPCSLPQ